MGRERLETSGLPIFPHIESRVAPAATVTEELDADGPTSCEREVDVEASNRRIRPFRTAFNGQLKAIGNFDSP